MVHRGQVYALKIGERGIRVPKAALVALLSGTYDQWRTSIARRLEDGMQ